MPRKPFFVVFFLFLTSFWPVQPGFANDSVVFGPVRFERDSGKPRTFITAFAGPKGISDFTMEIQNGQLEGIHRVSSATVSLNGKTIVGPRHLNPHVATIERTVSLESSNTLEVTLHGSPGSFITVRILGVSHAPIVNLSAIPESIVEGDSAALTWSSSNAGTCEIDQGVGVVSLAGTAGVAPKQTTTYTITARGPGGTTTASATVSVLNRAPVANEDLAVTPEDTAVAVDVIGNDAGTGLSVSRVTQGTYGEVSISPGGEAVTYTPESNFNGEDHFSYTVTDSRGATATGTVTVTVNGVNDSPVAVGQSISLDQDHTVSVLLGGSDPDGDGLSFVVVSLPAHGSLSGTPPHLTYSPDSGYAGPDGFTFKVRDGNLDSDPAGVSITVNRVNHPPAAVDDEATTDRGTAVVLSVLANDRDPDGDILKVASFTQGSHGNVAEGGSNTLVYTPAEGFAGEDRFTYSVSDGNGGSASGSVHVLVNASSSMVFEITSPLEGEFVAGPTVMVRGNILNQSGQETGVMVDGVMAQVYDGEFMASHVPLQDGENVIRAVAMDRDGNTASALVKVFGDHQGHYLRLYASTYSGLPPLEAALRAGSSPGLTDPAFSCSGPEVVDILDGPVPEERRARFPAEGLYQCTAVASDSDGRPLSDTVFFNVLSRDAVDGMLKARWGEMKQRLAAGAIDAALEYFSSRSRDRYRMIFEELSHRVPEIISQMEDIEMILCRDDAAEYRINRTHVVNGQPVAITYSIFFERDENGLWKISRF